MTFLALALLAVGTPADSTLSVAYRRDDRAAPLYAACLYPGDFRQRYNLYLRPVTPQQQYDLYDGRRRTLSIRFKPFDTDSAVLTSLLAGTSQVGILAPEPAMQAVLGAGPVKVIAPLQYKGDLLVMPAAAPVLDWPGFINWLKQQTGPVAVGYIGQEPMNVLGFEQALEYENITRTRRADSAARVRLVRLGSPDQVHTDLASGSVAAVVVESNLAAELESTGAARIVCELHDLAPNRFENRPATVIAALDSSARTRDRDIERFLELMGVATHYANNRTRNTFAAAARWLNQPAAVESVSLSYVGFSSSPGRAFRDGLWNWYFALRLKNAVPESLSGFMERDEWLHIPYDSSLVSPALDRAGARIVK